MTGKTTARLLICALLGLTVAACSADEVWRTLFETGKGACRNYPAHCDVQEDKR
jgi:hypothetical protein